MPNGILPLDRPNQVKLNGNYLFSKGLNLGVNVNLSVGQAAHADGGQPELQQRRAKFRWPLAASGIQTIDGFMTRSPFESQVDFQASYVGEDGRHRRLTFLADIFNLFNEQRRSPTTIRTRS